MRQQVHYQASPGGLLFYFAISFLYNFSGEKLKVRTSPSFSLVFPNCAILCKSIESEWIIPENASTPLIRFKLIHYWLFYIWLDKIKFQLLDEEMNARGLYEADYECSSIVIFPFWFNSGQQGI